MAARYSKFAARYLVAEGFVGGEPGDGATFGKLLAPVTVARSLGPR
jgi:hypothetical protein